MRTFYPSQFYSLQICHGSCRAIEHEEKLPLPSCFQAWALATAKTQALLATFVWDFAKEVEGKTFQKGVEIKSQKFSLLGVPDLQMSLYPQGTIEAKEGHMSLFLNAPAGWQINYKASLGDVTATLGMSTFSKMGGDGQTLPPSATRRPRLPWSSLRPFHRRQRPSSPHGADRDLKGFVL